MLFNVAIGYMVGMVTKSTYFYFDERL